MPPQPFKIAVPEAELADLKRRLENARWTEDFANDDWGYGANAAYLKELTAHWRDKYDWRATEARMNAFNHFRTEIDGLPIHFIHERGKGPAPIPLILNHGWPWTFWDYQKLIGPLSDPARYGGDPADAFDIIAPSLPGFGFSSPLKKTGINFVNTADMWVKLMNELGYARFASQGADWGAFVTAQLGHKHADKLIGIQLQLYPPLSSFSEQHMSPAEDYSADEQELVERNAKFFANEGGYAAIQSTKPQTPAVALNDSPIGLLAWIVEKRRSWSDSRGNVESRFSKDDLIDTIMIYWITQTFNTSARYYYEARHNPWRPSHDRWPVVEAPTAIVEMPREVVAPARAWTERYYNVKHWTKMPGGGHFGPMEQPKEWVDDIRSFFRTLR